MTNTIAKLVQAKRELESKYKCLVILNYGKPSIDIYTEEPLDIKTYNDFPVTVHKAIKVQNRHIDEVEDENRIPIIVRPGDPDYDLELAQKLAKGEL